MKIKPLGDRVIVEVLEAEEKTAGGIILPDSAKQEKQEGKVVAVGPGKTLESGKVQAVSVKKGDVVLFKKWGAEDLERDGKSYKVLSESDIIGIVE